MSNCKKYLTISTKLLIFINFKNIIIFFSSSTQLKLEIKFGKIEMEKKSSQERIVEEP